jgi:hypothetical protein
MSTIKVNKIENTSTTDGGIEVDVDGHVQIDGQQFPTEGFSNPNLIHNPTFSWASRGYSNGIAKNAVLACDRWRGQASTEGDITQSRSNLGASTDPYAIDKLSHAMKIENMGTNNGAADYQYIRQSLDGHTVRRSGWDYKNPNSYLTLSFWARASVTQTYSGYLHATEVARTYSYEFDLVADEWKLVTLTIPGNADLEFTATTAARMYCYFSTFWGTDWTDNSTVHDAWKPYVSTARMQDLDDTWAATTGATFEITGVKLEVGQKRTKFIHPDPNIEHMLMGHYCRVIASGEHYPVGTGSYYQTNEIFMTVNLGTRMRGTPTVYIEPGANTYDAFRRGGADSMDAPTMSNNARPWCVEFRFQGNVAGTQGDPCFIRTDNANCKIFIQSEIS